MTVLVHIRSKPLFPHRTVAIFNNWVPRLGAIYDLFGNGKTALKFNYGRFGDDPDIALATKRTRIPP